MQVDEHGSLKLNVLETGLLDRVLELEAAMWNAKGGDIGLLKIQLHTTAAYLREARTNKPKPAVCSAGQHTWQTHEIYNAIQQCFTCGIIRNLNDTAWLRRGLK